MIRIQRTVTTDRPVDRVFCYLSDFTNAAEWDVGTVACTLIDGGDRGDGGVGTSYLNVSTFLGRETQLTYVVQEFEPNSRYVIRGRNGIVTATDTMTMRATGGGTEIVYEAEFRFSGVARLFEPVLRFPLKRLGDGAERSLTAALLTL